VIRANLNMVTDELLSESSELIIYHDDLRRVGGGISGSAPMHPWAVRPTSSRASRASVALMSSLPRR
jgi:hypothetical protein